MLGVYTCLYAGYNITLSYVSGTASYGCRKQGQQLPTLELRNRWLPRPKNKKDPEQKVDTEGNEGRELAHSGVNNHYLW